MKLKQSKNKKAREMNKIVLTEAFEKSSPQNQSSQLSEENQEIIEKKRRKYEKNIEDTNSVQNYDEGKLEKRFKGELNNEFRQRNHEKVNWTSESNEFVIVDDYELSNDEITHIFVPFEGFKNVKKPLSDIKRLEKVSTDENKNLTHSVDPIKNPIPKKKRPVEIETKKAKDSNSVKNQPKVFLSCEENKVQSSKVDLKQLDIAPRGFLKLIELIELEVFVFDRDVRLLVIPQFSVSKEVGNHLDEDYYEGITQQNVLKQIDSVCKKFDEDIHQEISLYENFNLSEKSFLNHYVLASKLEQERVRSKLYLVLQFCHSVAQERCIEKRKKLFEGLFMEYHESLREIERTLESWKAPYEPTESGSVTSIEDVKNLKEFRNNSNFILSQELEPEIYNLLGELKLNSMRRYDKEDTIESLRVILEAEQIKAERQKFENNRILEESMKLKKFSQKEIEDLEMKSQILQFCWGFFFVSFKDNQYQFEIDTQIGITINKTQSTMFCRLLDSGKTHLKNKELLSFCVEKVNNGHPDGDLSLIEKIRYTRLVWWKIRFIDYEIFRINCAYPLKFHENNFSGIKFEFEYFSFITGTKIKFIILIPQEKVISYPDGVEVETQVLRGEGDKEKVIKEALFQVSRRLNQLCMFSKI